MNFLCKLVVVICCSIVVMQAAQRELSLDEIDLITGEIVHNKKCVTQSTQNKLEELPTDVRRSISKIENDAEKSQLCCQSGFINKKWIYSGAAILWGIAIGLAVYECGYDICDAGGVKMVYAYVFSGIGTGLAGSCCMFTDQDRQNLLN